VEAKPPPQWLFIVRRDQEALYRHLSEAFARSTVVQVILDRRQGERRSEDVPVGVERRRGDRRWPSMNPAEQELWQVAGFRLVLRTQDVEVYQAWDESPERPLT
jgi:hypothetical protein